MEKFALFVKQYLCFKANAALTFESNQPKLQIE